MFPEGKHQGSRKYEVRSGIYKVLIENENSRKEVIGNDGVRIYVQ